MANRTTTPPTLSTAYDLENFHCPGGSASTASTSSYYYNSWSPQTDNTLATTPPKSPGNNLVDSQAQWSLSKPFDYSQMNGYVGRTSAANHPGHSRTISCPSNILPLQYGSEYLPRSALDYRSVTPPDAHSEYTYVPQQLHYDMKPIVPTAANQPRVLQASSQPVPSARGHSRTGSSGSVNAEQLMRHGFPYRAGPAFQPVGMTLPPIPNALSHLAPIMMTGGQMPSYKDNRRNVTPPASRSRIIATTDPSIDSEVPTSTVLKYLTSSNPMPSLVKRLPEPGHDRNAHFWFDIRNVKPWEDFNVDTMKAVPHLLDLLEFPIPTSKLPSPVRLNQTPDSLRQLTDICAQHHAVKVNAALKITQGATKHITIRTLAAATAAMAPRQQPEFVANYQSDDDKIISGNGTGRVVGIVKGFEQWSSSMQGGTPTERVKYLRHLSHLHGFMREHGTRYGFIMTEVELVCVRAGGPPAADNVPLFGYLEVSPTIQVSTQGSDASGKLRMTVGLALWYLHMLAKEQPFVGQYHWRMDAGAPAALTRKRHLARDVGFPKPCLPEKREAKRVRGWVWPEEPLSKREVGKKPRARSGRS
ncbi:uncharacterized protein K489DRAFT_376373 [Dissoconium aciculare CBS 342.82]|uniref:Sialidase n=1 Tax=Dissoconium aciculare CBS 342.82 TaxID=1314786 RepID=A0A6J3MEE2_9PEZI|nr:uncharacterized protein K489DRAFT_376373 [Dissoconium aciculare CBS 342.82]KAF1825979.1 hypothetical protein K489DRAFT_376373 [Dissoconium aciculare CBS 342.82]